MSDNAIRIFSGESSNYIAEKIAAAYGEPLGKVTFNKFSDGEFCPSFEESIRGSDVFLIQSTFAPSDNLMELLLMVDAAKRASAKRIVAVVPYFGFARQDRKDKPRVAIGAKLVANLMQTAGISRLVTIDLHADQIQGFFEVPVDHLYASKLFLEEIKKLDLPNLMVAAPDTGGTKRANSYAKHLGVDMAICYKERKVANVVDSMTLIGDVKGKDVVLIDDIIDTAGTMTKAADLIMEKGASSVRAMCTHAVLSGPAYERIEKSALTELIVTDTIPLKQESDKIKVISIAGLMADVISNIVHYKSISSNFVIQ
jgi:ribose-phosphate pyrophosphokinase